MFVLLSLKSVSPGPIDTEFFVANNLHAQSDRFEDFLADLPMLKAEDVVDACIYVLSTPPHVQVSN